MVMPEGSPGAAQTTSPETRLAPVRVYRTWLDIVPGDENDPDKSTWAFPNSSLIGICFFKADVTVTVEGR
jgi:hypothetical protein